MPLPQNLRGPPPSWLRGFLGVLLLHPRLIKLQWQLRCFSMLTPLIITLSLSRICMVWHFFISVRTHYCFRKSNNSLTRTLIRLWLAFFWFLAHTSSNDGGFWNVFSIISNSATSTTMFRGVTKFPIMSLRLNLCQRTNRGKFQCMYGHHFRTRSREKRENFVQD